MQKTFFLLTLLVALHLAGCASVVDMPVVTTPAAVTATSPATTTDSITPSPISTANPSTAPENRETTVARLRWTRTAQAEAGYDPESAVKTAWQESRNLAKTINALTPTLTPSITKTPTPSSTPTAFWWFEGVNCVKLPPPYVVDVSPIPGTILFWKWEIQLMNMETGDTQILSSEGYPIPSSPQSPDHQWIAFHDYESNKLKLMDSKGVIVTIGDWDEERWLWIIDWIGSDEILIRLKDNEEDYKILPQGLFNIRTKTYREIVRDFPDYRDIYEHEGMIPWKTTTFFDPTLTRVGYTTRLGGFALYDLQSQQILRKLEDYGRPMSQPKWSPDGNYLLLSASFRESYYEFHDEFFLIHRDGKLEQLTNFNETFEESTIGSFSWSPDSKYVAFWHHTDTSNFQHEYISVLELSTRKVTTYCLANEMSLGPAFSPVWSPDSKSFIIRRDLIMWDLLNSQVTDVALIHIEDGYAKRLGNDLDILGWLVNNPEE